jgi:hypothetical protein
MKHKLAATLVALAVAVIVPTAVTAAEGGIPRWFSEFLAGFNAQVQQILSRLQGVEQQTAQNTAAIGLNTADIARNTLDISRNTADIAVFKAGALTAYLFADYAGANVVVRNFSSVGGGNCGNTETQTLTRTPQPDGSIVLTVDTVRRSGAVTCQHSVSTFRSDDRGQFLLKQDQISITDPSLILTTTVLDLPIQTRTAEMRIGASWGSGSKDIQTNVATGVQSLGFATSVSALTASESVTVPAGPFPDCLRMVEVRNSAHIGNFTQYDWFCRDVGLVRRVGEFGTAPIGFQIELQSFVTN